MSTETFATVDGLLIDMRPQGDAPGFFIRHPGPRGDVNASIALTPAGARGLAAVLVEQAADWDHITDHLEGTRDA